MATAVFNLAGGSADGPYGCDVLYNSLVVGGANDLYNRANTGWWLNFKYNDFYMDGTGNSQRIIASKGGLYEAWLVVSAHDGAVNNTQGIGVHMRKNYESALYVECHMINGQTGGDVSASNYTSSLRLNAGDFLDTYVGAVSGVPAHMRYGWTWSWFIRRIGD